MEAIVVRDFQQLAATVGAPSQWVIIASVVLLGIGILTGVTRTRSKDPPNDPSARGTESSIGKDSDSSTPASQKKGGAHPKGAGTRP